MPAPVAAGYRPNEISMRYPKKLLPLLAASLLTGSLQAHAASVLVRTPETNGQFVEYAQMRLGAGPIEVKIDTQNPTAGWLTTCNFVISDTPTAAPGLAERVTTTTLGGEVRNFTPVVATTALFTLGKCFDSSGTLLTFNDSAQVQVYPSDTQPVSGLCGQANGGTFSSFPAAGALCASGTSAVTDGQGADGTFNWSCQGAYGGTTAQCAATRYVAPPVDQGASFTGAVSKKLLNVTHTLSWNWPNATSCTASGAWGDAKATSGTQTFTYNAFLGAPSKTYTLTCTGAGGSASKTVTLK